MLLETSDYPATQSDQRNVQDRPNEKSLLTPARRAALDALEREFEELLQHAAR